MKTRSEHLDGLIERSPISKEEAMEEICKVIDSLQFRLKKEPKNEILVESLRSYIHCLQILESVSHWHREGTLR